MAFTPGARIGPYEIVGLLGAGGMGEVYRARDTRLHRQVALKVLPEPFALHADRLARFEREAQLLASLNHPNIANIHGIEDGLAEAGHYVRALVLELVEGPTLADRLADGPIPLAEALPMARQIADAVDAAHQQGVIHRDLKPANIKLRPDGTVKVLDFGLAKLVDGPAEADGPAKAERDEPGPAEAGHYAHGGGGGDRSVRLQPDLTASPTVTSPAMTRLGVILGTASYMSPEQARGLVVDKGADIWAFGCVLFEMLTGARAFGGDDATETIAAIVRAEPEWSRLPRDTPESIRRVLRRCLEKDRKRRLADIRDARLEIDEAERGPSPVLVESTGRGSRRERLAWSAALIVLALIAVAALARAGLTGPSSASPEMRLDIVTSSTTDPVSFDISPDGRHIAFVASSNGQPRLWLRSLASDAARPLAGTEGASYPFWSPDSRSIGFFTKEKLYRIDIDGGAPTEIAFAAVGAGGTWNRDGLILFPPVPDAPLFQVSDKGGEPRPVPGSRPGAGERYPQWLPDGRHFLYYVAESRGVFVGDVEGTERRRLLDTDAAAVFAAPGQLLFVLDGTLFSQGFDVDRLQLVGERSPVAEGVPADPSRGKAAVSASAAGIVVYRTGGSDQRRQLMWVNRRGDRQPIGEPEPTFPLNLALSPDGARVALNRSLEGNTDIWIHELGREGFNRFTFDALPEIVPVWSPDGSTILFARVGGRVGSPATMVLKSVADPTGPGEAVFEGPSHQEVAAIPLDWSRDGRFVLYRVRDLKNGWDVWAMDMEGRRSMPVLQTPFEDRSAQFSPNGGWLVYESNDSGRFETYVQPFPRGNRRNVSTAGGSQPRWSADGGEIFYIAPEGYLMAVPVRTFPDDRPIELGQPVRLFQAQVEGTVQGGITHTYVPSLDGQRFLMTTFVEQAGTPLTLVLNRGVR